MKIERLDPAVAAIQYLARAPVPASGVAQTTAAFQAGMNLEQQNRDSASNTLKARLNRLDKLFDLSGTANRLLGSLKKKIESDGGKTLEEEAAEALKLFAEMAEEMNLDGPPIFPPLPSPLARSLHMLKGYMDQVPDMALPYPSTEEGRTLERAAQLFLGDEGIFKTLKKLSSGEIDPSSASGKIGRLAEDAKILTSALQDSMTGLKKAAEWNPLAGQPFETAA